MAHGEKRRLIKLEAEMNSISMSHSALPFEAHSCMPFIVSSLQMEGINMTFPKANSLLGLLFFFSGLRCTTDAYLSILYEVHVLLLHRRPKWKCDNKETSQSSLFFPFRALETVPSYFVLFPFCTRRLLVFKMKDTCLAAFKESQHSESHLYCRAVHSPFQIQYGGDDQKFRAEGDAKRYPLWSKQQQQQSPDPQKTLF